MSSDWIIVGLTFVLVCTTIWYAVTTHRALSLANTANEIAQAATNAAIEASLEARHATEVALEGNLATARGFFGGQLVVKKSGEGGTFLVENIGNGLAQITATDFEINDPPVRPPRWRSMEAGSLLSQPVHGRGQEAQFHGTHIHWWELNALVPTNYRWQSEPSESRQVEARLKIVYSDGFRSDLEVFSAPFGLVHLDPPNSLL